MMWSSIRLELACSIPFPRGSAGRAYILCLPLGPDGRVAIQALRNWPFHASVRRFWPCEADLSGAILTGDDGLKFVYSDLAVSQRLDDVFLRGIRVPLREPDGGRLLFRVESMTTLGDAGV